MLCACGCGQELRPNAKWKYKHGHKSNPVSPKNTVRESTEMDFSDLNEATFEEDEETQALTLDDVAESIPDDPEPADFDDEPSTPTIRITKKVRDDVEGKVGLLLGMLTMPLAMRDPICGGALADNADNIASKLVPIVCKSPELVQWFTKKGTFLLWMELFMACWPVLQAIGQHHLFNSRGQANYDAQAPDYNQYSVD